MLNISVCGERDLKGERTLRSRATEGKNVKTLNVTRRFFSDSRYIEMSVASPFDISFIIILINMYTVIIPHRPWHQRFTNRAEVHFVRR